IDTTIELPKAPGGPTDPSQVAMPIELLKHVSCPRSLRKATMEHIRLGGWLVLYTTQRPPVSPAGETFLTQDVLGILKRGTRDRNVIINVLAQMGISKGTEGWGDVPDMRGVYVPVFGWMAVSGAEKVGNYIWEVRRGLAIAATGFGPNHSDNVRG
ncbi:hypothetical protein HOY80DRAFT_882459, partial [Tuber brumale]